MDRIVFITRATKDSGKGHFFRVLRMIEILSQTCDCVLVVDEDAITANSNFEFHPLNLKNPEALISELKLKSSDLLWFDVPDSQYKILESFSDLGFPLVSTNMFEKLGEKRFENIAIYPVFENYKKSILDKKTIQISGSDFISVPKEFFYKDSKKKPQVLVSMGGTDPMGFTSLVLESISKLKNSIYVFKIILPKGMNTLGDIGKYKACPHIKFHNFGDLNFANVLKSSEYAIINGGMTRYECIAAKTFFIALSIHDLQAELTSKVTKYGLGFNFGVFNEQKIESLSLLLSSLPLSVKKFTTANQMPLLKENGAKWIYEKVIWELNN
ncbi:hypothetical protein AB4275_17940 [Vibrio cyclitrophicus]